MRSVMRVLMVAVIGLAIVSTAGYGSKAKLVSSDIALISARDGSERRVLARFNLPQLSDGQQVYFADIQFHVDNLEPLQELELYELSVDWEPKSVEWMAPWDSPGGDVRGERKGYWITDERTRGLVRFVVTGSISRFMSGAELNHGFLILMSGEDAQRMALPSGSPILTIYSGPSRDVATSASAK